MKIDICMRVNDIEEKRVAGRVVVVFDVLRATSTIISALAAGCRGIIPAAEVDEAVATASRLKKSGWPVILGGERGGKKLPGFDRGNSPREYTGNSTAGKMLVLTTTNGTRTIRACQGAEKLYIGSIINAAAVARQLYEDGNDVLLVCAGTGGEFSLEDGVAAGLVASRLALMAGNTPGGRLPEMTDIATAMAGLADSYGNRIALCLYDSVHGKKLLSMGFQRDLEWCGRVDRFDIVPRLENSEGRFFCVAGAGHGISDLIY